MQKAVCHISALLLLLVSPESIQLVCAAALLVSVSYLLFYLQILYSVFITGETPGQ